MTLPFSLYGDLLKTSFVRGGRGPMEYDCLGLAMEVLRRRGIMLPDYVSEPEELHRALQSDGAVFGGMHKVLQPQGGEVALFHCPGRPCHIGVMINSWHMLHTDSTTGPVTERLSDPKWRRRLVGYYLPQVGA